MTRWVAIFQDHPEGKTGWIRREHGSEHFAYLERNSDRIRIGGGLREASDAWYCGGLWVLEVESREEAVALCEADPYFRLGLRRSYQLFMWGKAPCYEQVVL